MIWQLLTPNGNGEKSLPINCKKYHSLKKENKKRCITQKVYTNSTRTSVCWPQSGVGCRRLDIATHAAHTCRVPGCVSWGFEGCVANQIAIWEQVNENNTMHNTPRDWHLLSDRVNVCTWFWDCVEKCMRKHCQQKNIHCPHSFLRDSVGGLD